MSLFEIGAIRVAMKTAGCNLIHGGCNHMLMPDRVTESHSLGSSILRVVMQSKDGSWDRTYRLFAMKHETPPTGAPAAYFTVDIDQLLPIKDSGGVVVSTWCPCTPSGVFEGNSPEEALKQALFSLNSIANGEERDEQTKSVIGR